MCGISVTIRRHMHKYIHEDAAKRVRYFTKSNRNKRAYITKTDFISRNTGNSDSSER